MQLICHNLGQLKGRQIIDLTKRFFVFNAYDYWCFVDIWGVIFGVGV